MNKREKTFAICLVLVVIMDICNRIFLGNWGNAEFTELVIIAAIVTWLIEGNK